MLDLFRLDWRQIQSALANKRDTRFIESVCVCRAFIHTLYRVHLLVYQFWGLQLQYTIYYTPYIPYIPSSRRNIVCSCFSWYFFSSNPDRKKKRTYYIIWTTRHIRTNARNRGFAFSCECAQHSMHIILIHCPTHRNKKWLSRKRGNAHPTYDLHSQFGKQFLFKWFLYILKLYRVVKWSCAYNSISLNYTLHTLIDSVLLSMDK